MSSLRATIGVWLMLAAIATTAQTPYPENDNISTYPTGMYYQRWTATSGLNWTYPYSTKITINFNSPRNFELTTLGKAGEGLAFRQWDDQLSAWVPWKRILTDDGSGKVGIGVNAPLAALHVHEPTTLGSTAGNFQLLTQTSGMVPHKFRNNLWLLRDATGSAWDYSRLHDGISIDWSYDTPGVDTRTWWERDPKDNIQSWGDAASTYMTLASGKLGVGSTSPATKLHVLSSASSGIPHSFADILVEDSGSGMVQILTGITGIGYYGFADSDDTYVAGIQYEHTGNQMVFRVNDHLADVTINSNGNVGIGTQDPKGYRLAVAGKAIAEEVVVKLENNWPDYVFDDNYDLTPLDELKAYLEKHKHLPDVPPAQEMETSGVKVGEMNMILLRKAEELTLYLIQQQERIHRLEEEVSRLNKTGDTIN